MPLNHSCFSQHTHTPIHTYVPDTMHTHTHTTYSLPVHTNTTELTLHLMQNSLGTRMLSKIILNRITHHFNIIYSYVHRHTHSKHTSTAHYNGLELGIRMYVLACKHTHSRHTGCTYRPRAMYVGRHVRTLLDIPFG